MYYGTKRDDLRLPVEVVAGEPRVLVDAHVMDLLNKVDKSALFKRLTNDDHKKAWLANAATVRANADKTVSLNTAVVATVLPLGAPKRKTLTLNAYRSMYFKLEALRSVVDDEVREALSKFTRPFGSAYALAPLLNIETPGSTTDEEPDEQEDEEAEELAETTQPTTVAWDQHYNLIFFGPPGTGKSFQVQQIITSHLRATDDHVYRVTFHPEFSYFDFVGTYKPRVGWMKSINDFTDGDQRLHGNREPRVYYAFDPGPFSRALVHALKHPTQSVVVVVEEINRGNCAAIFGDVFQLLDRMGDDKSAEERGRSEYPIVPSAEWKAWLDEELTSVASPCWAGGRLRLPGNLYLYATMNTSDQSLFPMDTAFRRRWGLQYVGVDTTALVRTRARLHAGDTDGVLWVDFAKVLNEAIVEHTRSDDKQMGAWFVQRAPGSTFVADVQFRSKVLFYLWSEVFRDAPHKVFHPDVRTYDQLVRRHGDGQVVFADSIAERLRPKTPS